MSSHIPAWKRIAIKSDSSASKKDEDDPLNITTHLATGSLTKKEKKRIIRGESTTTSTKDKVKKPKRTKLNREERQEKRKSVLKDQLRYLIEFYTSKVGTLPETVVQLENVKGNVDANTGDAKSDEEEEEEEEQRVVTVWKFSKQKQNWLLKNIFEMDEIPIEYNSLVESYFQDLKGGAREELVKRCQSKVEEWNDYVARQEEDIKKMVEGEQQASEGGNAAAKEEGDTKEETEPQVVQPNKEIVQRAKGLLELLHDSPVELKNWE